MLVNYDTLDYLKSGIGDDCVTELIDLYFETSPDVLIQLKQAIDNKDNDKVAFWGHRLKGSSSTLGFEDIRDLSEEVEMLSRHGNASGAIEKYNAIIPLYKALEKEMNRKTAHPALKIVR